MYKIIKIKFLIIYFLFKKLLGVYNYKVISLNAWHGKSQFSRHDKFTIALKAKFARILMHE